MSTNMISELTSAGLSKEESEKLSAEVTKILSSDALSSEKWRQISKNLLSPTQPFAVHQYLFRKTYETDSTEPNYIWIPSDEEMKETNLYKYMRSQKQNSIKDLFAWADQNRELFWKSMLDTLKLTFDTDSEHKSSDEITVFDTSKGVEEPIYFPTQKMNASDWILSGDDSRLAIVWSKEGKLDSDMRPILNRISMAELKQSVTNIAYALTNTLALKVGDSVGIDMPMNWESVAIYLAIIKAGMAVVSIADSFAPAAIEVRLKISNAKAVFTQDVIARGHKKIPLYERVCAANALQCVVLSESDDNKLDCELRDCDLSWTQFLEGTSDSTQFASVSCDAMAVANILFSSGTTGEPKAIPWHHCTFIKPFADGFLHNDVCEGEVVAWPTNIGWMMGPWLIAQIGLGAGIALFVGSPSTPNFCKFVQCARIAHLGVIPSIVKAWMRADATKDCDWTAVRRYSSTGEASNPTLYHWLVSRSHYTPVMEYVGGTEIAGGYLGGTMAQPQLLSAFSLPCFGLNIHILDGDGQSIDTFDVTCVNGEGELTISPPSCGLSVALLNKDHKSVYYSDMPALSDSTVLRRHGDQLRIIAHGRHGLPYFQHLGRVDDTMNLGGIKISSVALENVILKHPLLSREVAAIAFRKNDIDTEELVVCAVPKAKDDMFEVCFAQKPLGLKLAPVKGNERVTLVFCVDSEQKTAEKLSSQENMRGQPAVYKINNCVVYGKVSFDETIRMIQSAEVTRETPMRVCFVRQSFNPETVQKELQLLVKKELNPLFRVRDLYLIQKLPRTASGKVMRRILRGNYSSSRN